jgi:hypothetical protein
MEASEELRNALRILYAATSSGRADAVEAFTFFWRREEGAWRVVDSHASLGEA